MLKTKYIAVLLFIFSVSLHAQEKPNAEGQLSEKMKKEVVEMIRETSGDIGRLRTMENRISFNSEIASLMWYQDEKEAQAMFGQVISDFKQLLANFDSEMNTAAMLDEDGTDGGFLFGGRGQSKVERKFRVALEVRKQIAMSLADHAPDLALNFYYDSFNLISNPEFRKQAGNSDRYFESTLLQRIAEKDTDKGIEYGKESIKRQINNTHIELLRKLYKKDPAKGTEFGLALLNAAKSSPDLVDGFNFYGSLISFATQNIEASKKAGGKPAIYSSSDIRDIAEMLYQALLAKGDESDTWQQKQSTQVVEQILPGRGAQLRAKFKIKKEPGVSAVANTGVSTASNSASSAVNPAMAAYERQRAEAEAKAKAEGKMFEDIKNLGKTALPKEERDKIITQARKIISETKGKDKKIMALGVLASAVAKLGDKDLANEIMRDAERMVDPLAKNYQDYTLLFMLAGGYAETDPEKAFALLESTILRANETLSAFVKVAEFIDVQEEIVIDGELQVGMFGGSMVRGLTGNLAIANTLIHSLATADLAKTRALTNSFDRTEIRVLTKMMVLRTILANNKKSDDSPAEDAVVMMDDFEAAAPPPPKPKPRR